MVARANFPIGFHNGTMGTKGLWNQHYLSLQYRYQQCDELFQKCGTGDFINFLNFIGPLHKLLGRSKNLDSFSFQIK